MLSFKDWVYEVIREGIQEFEENILLEEVLYNELVEESYKWYGIILE